MARTTRKRRESHALRDAVDCKGDESRRAGGGCSVRSAWRRGEALFHKKRLPLQQHLRSLLRRPEGNVQAHHVALAERDAVCLSLGSVQAFPTSAPETVAVLVKADGRVKVSVARRPELLVSTPRRRRQLLRTSPDGRDP